MLIIKNGQLTAKSDKSPIVVTVCHVAWFDLTKTYQIANAPARTSSLVFTGADLNFVARVLYAESSGSAKVTDRDERMKEKAAILNVKHFRLNRMGYPNRHAPQTFTDVCQAKGQFESVYSGTPKFSGSDPDTYESLSKPECFDLEEAIDAVREFLKAGPNSDYLFDNFRGGRGSRGTTIGQTRFWLSPEGERLYEKHE
ncbi:hypothetical protein GCM10025771_07950 [Niveibacterium umoris]|uniref:Uncharacterized protein n=1 Tax=Niveibacterium umoris TaxID=1193620 RepID=A0A840BQ50_9RHOO|nr:hypothetical protein [Niveibacterium umoris]MBB4013658.1 hypothetical protein [Niveibacterium umoris]